MDTRHAALQQFQALRGGVRGAELHHGIGIVATAVEFRGQPERQRGAAHTREAFHLGGVRDRHNAGDDRHGYAVSARKIYELEILAIFEKELRNDERRARIHFALQMCQVDIRIAAFNVFLGVAGNADAQLTVVIRSYELDDSVA